MPRSRWYPLLALIVFLDLAITWVHPNADPPRGYSTDHALVTDGFWYLAQARGWTLDQEPGVSENYQRPLVTLPAAFFYWLGGVNLASSRCLSSLASVSTILLLAYLLRRRRGEWVALVAALALALNPAWHAHVRSTIVYPWVAFWLLATFGIAAGRSWWRWALGAAFLALGALFLKSILWLGAPALAIEAVRRYGKRPGAWGPLRWSLILAAVGLLIGFGGPWIEVGFWNRMAEYSGWSNQSPWSHLLDFQSRSLLFSSLPMVLPFYWLGLFFFFTRIVPVRGRERAFESMAHLTILSGLTLFALCGYTPLRYMLMYLPLMVYCAAMVLAVAEAYPRVRRTPRWAPHVSIAFHGGFALGTVFLASQWWRATQDSPLPWTGAILVTVVGGLGIWLVTLARALQPRRRPVLITGAFLLLILPAVPRLRAFILSPEFSLERTGEQVSYLIEPRSRLFGNFAHAVTANTRIEPQNLYQIRYGKGDLARSFQRLGSTHLFFDCDDSSAVPGVFARQGLALEELDRYFIHGTELRLFRLPGAPRSLFEQALESQQAGDLDTAETLLRSCLQQHPRSAATWHRLGSLLLERGKREVAYKCFVESIAHDPNRAHAYREAARLAYEGGRSALALAHLQSALAVTPADENLAGHVAQLEREIALAHASAETDPGS